MDKYYEFFELCNNRINDFDYIEKLFDDLKNSNNIDSYFILRAFLACCKSGNHELIDWLWNLNEQHCYALIDINENDDHYFKTCCASGYTDLAKWFYNTSISTGHLIDIHQNDELYFRICCEKGYIDLAKWLLDVSVDEGEYLNIHIGKNSPLISGCLKKQNELVKWLYQYGIDNQDKINLSVNNFESLRISCYLNNCELAEWLLDTIIDQYKSTIIHDNNIGEHINYLFIKCCRMGFFGIIKLLYHKLHSFIDININNNMLFEICCIFNYTDILKWLYDISFDNNQTVIINNNYFRLCCINNSVDSAKWIYSKLLESNQLLDIFSCDIITQSYINGCCDIVDWLDIINCKNKYDIKANSCLIFRILCKNIKILNIGQITVLLRLTRLNSCFRVSMINNVVNKWKINKWFDIDPQKLYIEIPKYLPIKSKSDLVYNDNNCYICNSHHQSKLIILHCMHVCCCCCFIQKYFIEKCKYRCVKCKTRFKLEQCSSFF